LPEKAGANENRSKRKQEKLKESHENAGEAETAEGIRRRPGKAGERRRMQEKARESRSKRKHEKVGASRQENAGKRKAP
jgi:hypothetical protein